MQNDILKKLKNVGLLSEQTFDYGNVSTGSYALNRVISGDYLKGLPIGGISQFIGKSSTAKTVWGTECLIDAQKKGWHAVLIDSEMAYSPDFAARLGLDSEKLVYASPETLEDCFDTIEKIILAIRETDKETPIVIVYDSLAVSPCKAELEAKNYDSHNMMGAIRAKLTGAALRKANGLMRKHKAGLIIVNQFREKTGMLYGNPETAAAGGNALEFYLAVNLRCASNKTTDVQEGDFINESTGIRGHVKNIKNKISIPFRKCDFELRFDKGITSHWGLVDSLIADGSVVQDGSWYQHNEEPRFQKKTFYDNFPTDPKFASLREIVTGSPDPL
jgi:recombination protein RecA